MSTKHKARKSDKNIERRKLKKHDLMTANKPKDIDKYIDDNVIDIDSAKEILKLIAKIVLLKP